MNVTVYIKNSTEKQIKNFKIGKNSGRGYFKRVLDGIRKFKGTVFVKSLRKIPLKLPVS